MGFFIICFIVGGLVASLALGTWLPGIVALAVIYFLGKAFNHVGYSEDDDDSY